MKKIFSAALALVCVWFATPALAVCENLYKTQNGTAAYLSTDCSAASYSSYLTTDFIPIEANTTYTFYSELTTTLSGHAMRICFYDSDKNKVGNRGGGDVSAVGHYAFTHTSPSNAAYIRVSSYQPGVALINPIIIKGDYSGHEAYDQCYGKIQIATTKYNETAFGPLNTALANAISVVDSVVSNTITQAGRIATLQAQKQTRPNETCPAGKKCLLVEDASGVPHWYEIVETLLPAGYIQLQWIKSTGTQWIDTGYVLNSNTDNVEIVFQADSAGTNINLFGARNSTTNRPYTFGAYQGGWRFGWYDRSEVFGTADTNKHTVKIEHTGGILKIDDVIIAEMGSESFTTPFNAALFGVMANSMYYGTFTIYSYKKWTNDELVQYFIPAKRNSDSAIGMYDTVSGQFFTNQGTGEFIAGDPVSE